MKKRIILLVCGIVGCLGILFSFQLKNKNNLQENNIKNKNGSLAIMIKENGATDYTKSSSNSIPIGDYILNEEKTTCENGGKISDYNSTTGKIKMALLGADKCYLYFDYKESKELYKLIAKRYNKNDAYVKLYNGSDASTYANPVYYFNGAVENNNVLFGGFCWKMVRTTDTGGIKMIYNGVPEFDSTPLARSEYTNLNNDATYPFTFDSTSSSWTNNQPDVFPEISFNVPSNGTYIFNYNISSSGGQMRSYLIIYIDGVENAHYGGNESGKLNLGKLTINNVIKIVFQNRGAGSTTFNINKVSNTFKSCDNISNDSQLVSIKAFNSSYNSLAYVGYMYNTVYPYSQKNIIDSSYFSGSKIVGYSVTYSSNTYTLNNTSTVSVSSSNISSVVGKYTCNSSSSTSCSSPYYIVGYSGTTIYSYRLSGGNTDGTSYSKNYVFGNSFTYVNGTYTLTDTITINSNNWPTKYNTISSNHYTCFTDGTTCTSLYYVYYTTKDYLTYITLTNGKSANDALNEMLYADDVNKNDSTIKSYIDSWYKDNMTSYTDKLEDTIFCNDRTMSNQSANGWNPNGGSTTTILRFKNYNTNYNLACTNETDRFSVSNNKAKLTYPIGLLSAPEVWLAYKNADYSTYYLNSSKYYWLISPRSYEYYPINIYVDYTGTLSYGEAHNYGGGVRPVVSLKPGTEYTTGDGSYALPFIVE